jgi:hypothetical protein
MQDELSVTLDEVDFIEAYRPPRRSRRQSSLVLLLTLALALLIAALLVRFPEARYSFEHSRLIIGLTGAVGLAASLVTALLIAAPSLRRRAARNTLENHPGLRDPVHYAFDADRFSVRTTYTQATYPWAQLWDWRETHRVLIVLPTPRNFYVLPKRDVDPAVLNRLRGHLARARKRVRSGRAS